MKKSDYLWKSFPYALGTFTYIATIALFLFNGQHIFGDTKSFLIPVFMLLLLVISATITGLLVLGKPVTMYLNNLKKEAFVFLFTTLSWLAFFLVIVVLVLVRR